MMDSFESHDVNNKILIDNLEYFDQVTYVSDWKMQEAFLESFPAP